MMSSEMQIQNFNQKLIEENIDINIIDYVKLLNDQFYNIDISFINDFISLVGKNECCIHHDMLEKYGVLTLTGGTTNVKRIIDQNVLKVGDCPLYNVVDRDKNDQAHKINYFLHPRLFKFILIRSKNNTVYAEYYIFLEEAIKHYSDFQIMKLEDKLNKKSTISILNLIDKDTLDRFVLAKNSSNKEYPYLNIRGQERHIRKVKKECEITESDILIDLNVPHAINFFNKCKEVLKTHIIYEVKYIYKDNDKEIDKCDLDEYENDDIRISITRNFNITGITEADFINKIKQVNEMRYKQ